MTLSDTNTEAEVDYMLEKIPAIVAGLRDMSPVWEDLMSGKKPHLI